MISRDQLISAIEDELVHADNATNNETFNKHMHAIHTLSGLIDAEEGNNQGIEVKQPYMKTSSMPIKRKILKYLMKKLEKWVEKYLINQR